MLLTWGTSVPSYTTSQPSRKDFKVIKCQSLIKCFLSFFLSGKLTYVTCMRPVESSSDLSASSESDFRLDVSEKGEFDIASVLVKFFCLVP
jgi:hypothetical protein